MRALFAALAALFSVVGCTPRAEVESQWALVSVGGEDMASNNVKLLIRPLDESRGATGYLFKLDCHFGWGSVSDGRTNPGAQAGDRCSKTDVEKAESVARILASGSAIRISQDRLTLSGRAGEAARFQRLIPEVVD